MPSSVGGSLPRSRSARLQAAPIVAYDRLVEALQLREVCFTSRDTYDAVAPRSSRSAAQSRRTSLSALAADAASGNSLGETPGASTLQDALSGVLDMTHPLDAGVSHDLDATTSPDVASLGGSLRRVIPQNCTRYSVLLGPVPVPVQEDLCRFWIERRTGVELDAGRPLADALVSGFLLCKLLDVEAATRPPRTTLPWKIAEKNLAQFIRVARQRRIGDDLLFEPEDLLYRRNVPRVLRTVAAIARLTDPEGFGSVAADLPGSRLQWTQADEPDEFWVGDTIVQRLVKTHQRLSWRAKLCLLVAGSQGSGKSATVDMLMGRTFMPASHAFGLMANDLDYNEVEQKILQQTRRAAHRHWPHLRFERGVAMFSDLVCKLYVKLSGVSMQVIELPAIEKHIESSAPNGLVQHTCSGEYKDVKEAVQGDEVDLVLFVERLDEFASDRFTRAYRNLHRLYGTKVWRRTVAVLTHGHCLPPDGLGSYDEYVARQTYELQRCVQRVSGDPAAAVPVVVVENSEECPVSEETGRPVLPNGVDFRARLLVALELVLARHQEVARLRPAGVKRWWEEYLIVAIGLWLVTRI
jgi:hypothetical protein